MPPTKKLFLLLLPLLILLLTLPLLAQDTTPDFSPGDEVIVYGQAEVLLIYGEPGDDSTIVEATTSGITLIILEGPRLVDGINWWKIESPLGTQGWVIAEIDGEQTLIALGGNGNTDPTSEPTVRTTTTPNRTSPSNQSTPSATGSEIEIGSEVTVYGQAEFLLMYAQPDTNAEIVNAVLKGMELTVIGGPQETETGVWWQVRALGSIEGWVPEEIDGQQTILLPSQQPGSDTVLGVPGTAVVAGQAQVLLIYAEPDESSAIVEGTVSGTTLSLIDRTETENGILWWKVRSPSGIEGWVLDTIGGQPAILPPGLLPTPTPIPTSTPRPTVVVPTPVIQCPGAPASRMVVGQRGRVTVTDGTPNRFRSQPSTNARIMNLLEERQEFDVIGGPECADSLTWWQINYRGTVGWMAEGVQGRYWIEPLIVNPTPTVAAALTTPSPQTIANCTVVATTNANLRSGPGTAFFEVDEINRGETSPAVAQMRSPLDYTWWQLSDGSWVREDVVTAEGDCESLPTLTIGGRARVNVLDEGLRMREIASVNSNIVGNLPNDSVVEVVGGPQTAEGFTWWQVRTPTNVTGWVVEAANQVITLIPLVQ